MWGCFLILSFCLKPAEDKFLVKDRWIINVDKGITPRFFTFTYPDGSSDNYFYFTITLKFEKTFFDEYKKNRAGIPQASAEDFIETIEEAPLQYLDIKLLCPNVTKVLTKTTENDHNIYEYEYNDTILVPLINRQVEYKILESLLKIQSYPLKEKISFIKKKKRKGELLNLNELRLVKRYLRKGESVSVLVYFRNFPLRATSFRILVSGIIHPVLVAPKKFTDISDTANVSTLVHLKTAQAAETEKKVFSIKRFVIENRYVVISYDFPGDPYERHLDMPKFREIKTFNKKVDGVTDIQMLENLINILVKDRLFINRVTSFNILKILLPIEIFPDCLTWRDDKELKYSTKEEALNSQGLKCIPKFKADIIETAEKFRQKNKLEKLEIPNMKIICLKEMFDDLCAKELKFNWLRLKDKIAFNPSTYSYEIRE